ncbi:MAG: alpha/beta hydrolase, partial [Chloroflexota bacterium]
LRRVARLAAGAFLAWVALLAVMVAFEGRFIYFPQATLVAGPEAYGLAHTELWLQAPDGVRLHGWWLHGRGERMLVWYHGNAGNVSHRLENASRFVDRFGLDIVLVDYRGYGRSEGTPSESGLYADGRAMYQVAVDHGFRPEQIVLFGRSLGAAVAVDVALDHPARALVLEMPFLSVPAMARAHYPFVPAFLIRSRFDSEAKIGRLAMPKLIIQAERDEIVPPGHARRLLDVAAPPKRLYVLPGAFHNDVYRTTSADYFDTWRRFLASLPAPGTVE